MQTISQNDCQIYPELPNANNIKDFVETRIQQTAMNESALAKFIDSPEGYA